MIYISTRYAGNGFGKNEWVGSLMQTYLNDNGDYYRRIGTASNYGLKANAKTLISEAKYYLGGNNIDNIYNFGTADAIYLWERGTNVFNFDNHCLNNTWDNRCTVENYCENNSTDEICTATRNISWVGEVALIYPSDEYLVYANEVDSRCYGDPYKCTLGGTSSYGKPDAGWVYNSNNLEGQDEVEWNWFLSSDSGVGSALFVMHSDGKLFTDIQGNETAAVRPILYLSSNVKITDGTGESTNPYKLGL